MLSKAAEYALRASVYLANAGPEKWVLNRQLAEDLDLPSQFLTKILRTLAAEGILESQRGRTGGFRLQQPPEEITLYEIISPFDDLKERTRCLLGQNMCNPDTHCPLHDRWAAVVNAFLETLHGTTLSEIVNGDRSAVSEGLSAERPKGRKRAPSA